MMEPERILTCGYSRHEQPFKPESRKPPLAYYLFRLQTDGFCQAILDGSPLDLTSGSLLLCKPGDRYNLSIGAFPNNRGEMAVSSSDYYLACCGSWIDQWWSRSVKSRHSRITPDEKLISLWRQLILEHRRIDDRNEELIGYLLRALCLTLDRALLETSMPRGDFVTAIRMKHYIMEHAFSPFKVEDVACYAGLSVSRAVHLFKDCTGTTMISYAQDVRLAAAVERMLYSSMSLEQIAESCGFGSYTYFFRVFRQRYGISPSQYRRQEPELRETQQG
ncbi:MAG: AraC family transcriptional regulator [Paenibacillaceae bacterium]|jgi:AraC family transcriptional regulator of arabinose operon|nr:AraC family transcriptional regulator [Paenibacillaceae bacterium]